MKTIARLMTEQKKQNQEALRTTICLMTWHQMMVMSFTVWAGVFAEIQEASRDRLMWIQQQP